MRLSKATAFTTAAIFLIMLVLDYSGQNLFTFIMSIDGGTWIFLLLIFAVSQLYTLIAHKYFNNLLTNLYVGILSNITAILTIYIVGASVRHMLK